MQRRTFAFILILWLSSCSCQQLLALEVGNRSLGEHALESGENSTILSAGVSSPVLYQPQNFDVLHYDVVLNLSAAPALTTSLSRCAMTFVWTSQPDTFRFHLRSLGIDSCYFLSGSGSSQQQVNVTPQQRETPVSATFHYAVPALATHKTGDTVRLVVVYSGTMTSEPTVNGFTWGGVFHDQTDAVYSLGVGFYNNYVSCAQHWMPCYDLPSDKATLSIVATCPIANTVVSNGLLAYDSTISSSLRVVRWDMTSPCATNLYTFAVGPYIKLDYGNSSGGKPQVVYAKKADTASVRISFKHLGDMVSTLESLYGPYPFEKVGYVVTDKGSMEHQTMISLGRAELGLKDTVNKDVAHELAHQWFGDLVTPYDYRDAWLCESFATYSESAWLESVGGKTQYLADTKSKAAVFMADYGRPGGQRYEGILSMYDFTRKPPSSNYPQTIYLKGAVVLGQLRYLVGDSTFYTALRNYLTKNANANADYNAMVQSFKDLVPASLKDSVTDYFQQWVKGKGWPLLDIKCVKMTQGTNSRATLHVTQTQTDSLGVYTWFPLELGFRDNTSRVMFRVVTINAKSQDIILDSLYDFQSISVNNGVHVNSLVTLTSTPIISEVASDSSNASQLMVFPNPSADFVWIRVPQIDVAEIDVVDVLGNKVLHVDVPATHDQVLHVDVQGLSAGTYSVRMHGAFGLNTAAFTIAR